MEYRKYPLSNVFSYNNHNVRTVVIDNEPWFVLSDACKVLGISHVATVKERLSDDVVLNHTIPDSLGRMQKLTTVNEDGLYDVILDSKKPEAKAFRKWITKEVIPSIHKTSGIFN